MNRIITFFLAISVLCWGQQARGCIPIPPNVEGASAIFVGYVTGERWPDIEAKYAQTGQAGPTASEFGYPVILLRVVRTEQLKGMCPRVVEAVSPCALPIRADERVVAWHSAGIYWVYLSS